MKNPRAKKNSTVSSFDPESLYPVRTYIDAEGQRPEVSPDLLRKMLKYMIWNREIDERLTKLQRQGRIGFYVGATGEEGAMIGTAAALEAGDWVVPCYREAGVAVYRGLSIEVLVANMFGRDTDPVKGRQMPCHYLDKANNFLSISSPVGTQITHAMGIAWAAKLRKEKVVSAVYFGDGATSQGDFHNGLNFAAVFGAPVLFLCRNNRWAISTPFEKQTATPTIAQKALAYGVHSERVDGNDAVATYLATLDAAKRARAGQGPTLLELCTYRLGAHSTSDDPRSYRNDKDVESWEQRDPIVRLRGFLEKLSLWSPKDEEQVRAEIAGMLAQAIEKAEKAVISPVSDMFDDVFAEKPWFLREQEAELKTALYPEGE